QLLLFCTLFPYTTLFRSCFVPNVLAKFYPRGERELKGPFHSFCTGDVMQWFEDRDVALKIEEDGRVFPESDSSQTIIDCFLSEAKSYDIKIITQTIVQTIEKENDFWKLETSKDVFQCKQLV